MDKALCFNKDQIEFLYDQLSTLQLAVSLVEKQYEMFMDNYAKENFALIKESSEKIKQVCLSNN